MNVPQKIENSVPPVTIPTSSNQIETRSKQAGLKRVDQFMGHAYKMIEALGNQNKNIILSSSPLEITTQVQKIYQQATKDLEAIHSQLNEHVLTAAGEKENENVLSKKDIKTLAKLLEKAKEEIAEIMAKTQVNLLAEIAVNYQEKQSMSEALEGEEVPVLEAFNHTATELKKVSNDPSVKDSSLIEAKVRILAENGWKAKILRLVAKIPFINESAKQALESYTYALKQMTNASSNWTSDAVTFNNQLKSGSLTELDSERISELVKGGGLEKLSHRAGVLGIAGIYRFQVVFSKSKMSKQFKSFIAQDLSNRERRTINKSLQFKDLDGNAKPITSSLIPLNTEFDKSLDGQIDQAFSKVFGYMFGNTGISSMNRQEAHLVNGWVSTLKSKSGEVLQSFMRSGIMSATVLDKDPEVRKEKSIQAAEDLYRAILLQEIASQGYSLKEIQEKIENNQPIQLNVNSVSLVTPDIIRQFQNPSKDEKMMLENQHMALHSFEGAGKTITLKGVNVNGKIQDLKVPVDIKVNDFNFGVNQGAVGPAGLGLSQQYEQNTEAFKGLKAQYQQLERDVIDSLGTSANKNWTKENRVLIDDARTLLTDIETLMENEGAYLKGQSQYAIGAKIVNLTNVMHKIKTEILKRPDTELAGLFAAINCFSGKDRTGWMASIINAYATMKDLHGRYITENEFENNPVLREQFKQVLILHLKESGSVEIPEINTDAPGFKVGEEARIAGITISEFRDSLGLSKTTSS